MNWDIIEANFGRYLQGLELTLYLTVVSLSLGFVLAIGLALVRNSDNRLANGAVLLYTTLLIVEMYLMIKFARKGPDDPTPTGAPFAPALSTTPQA